MVDKARFRCFLSCVVLRFASVAFNVSEELPEAWKVGEAERALSSGPAIVSGNTNAGGILSMLLHTTGF